MCLNCYLCFAFQHWTVRMQPGVPGDNVLKPVEMEQESGVGRKLYRKHTAEYVMVNQLKRNHANCKNAPVRNIYILIKKWKIWQKIIVSFFVIDFFNCEFKRF